MSEMNVNEVAGVTVVSLKGELTNAGIANVERAFVMTVSAAIKLVVDLSGVSMITTPGITMLVAADKQIRRRSGKMVLCGVMGNVEQVLLDRCRLDAVLNVKGNQTEAIEAARA